MNTDYGSDGLNQLNREDIFALLLICAGLVVSSSSGVGGGSITIPLLIILLKFKSLYAIPLGNIAVVGSAALNLLFNMCKYHPVDPTRSLIDWDVISMMEPSTMIGTLIGTYLHRIMPEKVTIWVLIILLGITTVRMLIKGVIDIWYHSNRCQYEEIIPSTHLNQNHHEQDETSLDYESKFNSLSPSTTNNVINTTNHRHIYGTTSQSFEIYRDLEPPVVVINVTIHENYNAIIPWDTLFILTLLFSTVCIINLLKGWFLFHYYYHDIISSQNVSLLFNIILVGYIIIMGLWLRSRVMMKLNTSSTSNTTQTSNKLLHSQSTSDVEWNTRNSIVYPILCITAGVAAGSLGIGGGIIKTPLMLEMGIHPHVATATATAMIFFTTIIAASSYIVDGTLIKDYGIVMFCIGLVSNVISQKILTPFILKHGHASMITILVGLLVGISATLMIFEIEST